MSKIKMIEIKKTEAVEKRIKELELVEVISNKQLEVKNIYKDEKGQMYIYNSYADYLNSGRWVSKLELI